MSESYETGVCEGLRWHAVGSGPTVLCLHGGMGFNHQYFRPWLDPLGQIVRMVYFDQRGNGESAEPEDWSRVTHASWAQDVDRLRAHLGAEQVVLLGHSYGGIIAQEYALQFPQHVAGLILCDTYPSFAHAPVALANAAARGTPSQLEALQAGLSAPVPDQETFERSVREILSLYFHRPTAPRLEAVSRGRFRVQAFNHAFFQCLPTFSTVGRLGAVSAPTLVVNGDDDWIAPTAHGAALLHAEIPNAELRVIADAGHFPFIERPAAFREACTEWLRRTQLC